jgi:hypothetical protein
MHNANALNDKGGVPMHISRRVRHAAPDVSIWVYPDLSREKQAMEMTEYGKHGKP